MGAHAAHTAAPAARASRGRASRARHARELLHPLPSIASLRAESDVNWRKGPYHRAHTLGSVVRPLSCARVSAAESLHRRRRRSRLDWRKAIYRFGALPRRQRLPAGSVSRVLKMVDARVPPASTAKAQRPGVRPKGAALFRRSPGSFCSTRAMSSRDRIRIAHTRRRGA